MICDWVLAEENSMVKIEFETPTLNEKGAAITRTRYSAEQFTEKLGNGVNLEMILIQAGGFQMGSLPAHGNQDERPRHFVPVKSIMLGKFLVTQMQWKAVMGKLPACRFKGDELPIEQISWEAARKFCQRLTKKTMHKYRLPSEAEWEYACRAGTSTPFSFGETLTTDYANYVGEHTFRSEPPGIYRHCPTEGGLFPPNAFGLYDMHGNLWEWCADGWLDDYSSAPRDGSAYENRNDPYRVVRGGSWHEPPDNCRSATRIRFLQNEGEQFIGFRVACDDDGLNPV
jgi:formylglycine-generating enzyme required for sulfatase activity